mmetsp:Transcript_11842/g.27302  ORF Transcript_11842/g.27302 Transcript_11842/m.27302 type:complete len:254 (+) Transcript_11842:462-1223(+)
MAGLALRRELLALADRRRASVARRGVSVSGGEAEVEEVEVAEEAEVSPRGGEQLARRRFRQALSLDLLLFFALLVSLLLLLLPLLLPRRKKLSHQLISFLLALLRLHLQLSASDCVGDDRPSPVKISLQLRFPLLDHSEILQQPPRPPVPAPEDSRLLLNGFLVPLLSRLDESTWVCSTQLSVDQRYITVHPNRRLRVFPVSLHVHGKRLEVGLERLVVEGGGCVIGIVGVFFFGRVFEDASSTSVVEVPHCL